MRWISAIVLLLAVFLASTSYGQSPEAMAKIQSARIGLISERLGLTPDQAERFWPLYREFNEKRRGLRTEMRTAREGVDPQKLSDEQGRELMSRALDIKQRELDLEKEYSQKMLNVISTQQVMSLRKAEDDFRRMLMKRLEQRQRDHDRNQRMRDRREDILREQRNN